MWELLSCYSSSKFNVLPCRATPPLMLLPGMAIMPHTSMISANSMLSTQCPLIIVWVCVFSVLISIETSVQHKIVEEIFKHMFQSETCISNGKTLIYCPPPHSLSLPFPPLSLFLFPLRTMLTCYWAFCIPHGLTVGWGRVDPITTCVVITRWLDKGQNSKLFLSKTVIQ